MTVTRSRAGVTPRKVERPDFVETPTRRSRTKQERNSKGDGLTAPTNNGGSESEDGQKLQASPGAANGATINGHAKGEERETARDHTQNPIMDTSEHFEFGGSFGVSCLMLGFPLWMWYMWIGATFYNGQLPLPTEDESIVQFVRHMWNLVYEYAFPTPKACVIYWTFLLFQGACYMLLPGITVQGKPLLHEGGKRLPYYCSGIWSFYVTIAVMFTLHATGLFKLYTLIDEFGPLMTVAIITGFAFSFIAYFSAKYRGAEHKMTGYPVYDFFMGAELNPRIFGLLDLKMFLEVRIPWYMLFLTSCGAAARQYEVFGYVSGEVGFLVMAHFLYANACSKGEELIVTTWDMYTEKLGFMLAFWNLAGVPLSYCHCTIYLANNAPSEYHWNRYALVLFYTSYIFMYWVWDTANSQKNRFRHQERGTLTIRKAPLSQLPWGTISNPDTIPTKTGDSLLVDGWYKYARKIHYTADMYFALSWALITGFKSPLPYFYPVFFALMIAHRAYRDIERCREKYGDAWLEYEKRVPYLFIPYVF